MPVSKNALIRYRTIDRCLRNHYRKWTLADLINACSDALSEYEGRDENVSRRTVQADIQMMRSDKLGYNAPIVVRQNREFPDRPVLRIIKDKNGRDVTEEKILDLILVQNVFIEKAID